MAGFGTFFYYCFPKLLVLSSPNCQVRSLPGTQSSFQSTTWPIRYDLEHLAFWQASRKHGHCERVDGSRLSWTAAGPRYCLSLGTMGQSCPCLQYSRCLDSIPHLVSPSLIYCMFILDAHQCLALIPKLKYLQLWQYFASCHFC